MSITASLPLFSARIPVLTNPVSAGFIMPTCPSLNHCLETFGFIFASQNVLRASRVSSIGENEEVLLLLLYTQAGPDGEITAEEQVQMLLDAKLHCLHTISTHELAGKKTI